MLLRTEGIDKRFGETHALQEIDFSIEAGEVHGLVGENGAGKSTLIKILTGVYKMDSGKLFWNGQQVHIESPVQSRELGINVIHQDRNLVPAFNGVENIYLGIPYQTSGPRVNWKAMRARVEEVLENYGIEVNLDKAAMDLTPPERTMLEIARAMMTDCKLLILDEPTASLTDKETEALFKIIERLKQKGTSILYVTHRMDEIFRLTDRITVFKNGAMVETVATGQVDKNGLISMMTDNWASQKLEQAQQIGDTLLKVEGLKSKDNVVKEASFELHKGEILGVFGLGGSGRTELLECIYGYRPVESGTIEFEGVLMRKHSPSSSLKEGIVLICEDRRGMALVPTLNIKDNIVLSTIDHYKRFLGVADEKQEMADTEEKIQELAIKTQGATQPVLELSGGNQQKVVFAKALMSHPKVLLCDEPTQAVDVKTRSEIHKLIRNIANEGNGVVFVSSDLKEVLEVADRIQVFAEGKTIVVLKNEGLMAEDVLRHCYAH